MAVGHTRTTWNAAVTRIEAWPGPVLPEILRDTGLNPASSALVTTLPVLLLGLFGLAAPGFPV